MSGIEKPMGISIMICDRVITEAGTNNKTLVSTFNSISSKVFPCVHPALTVYVALTNAVGDKEVQLVFAKEDKKLLRLGGKVNFPNPNEVQELIFNLRNIPLVEPGLYAFEVWAQGEYIFESRFNVAKVN